MTEEKKTPDPGAAHDAVVSDIYRDLAQERTPERLDQAVLREAARASRPRYSRLRLWTRPAAWAAVVLLSATLLLQVSQNPLPTQLAEPQALELEDRAAKATGTAAPRQAEPLAEVLEEAANQDADMLMRAEEMARIQQGPNDATRADAPQPASLRSSFTFASTEKALPSCGDEARATPEIWLECITDLEEAGFDVAAEQERELFKAMFPDVETP